MSEAADDELRLRTAFHEAAHAAVCVALGVKVQHATIRPEPASEYYPGSLGHVCHYPHPIPRPEDGWPNSHWVESWVLVKLAGYATEDLLWPESTCNWGAVPDHLLVLDMYRLFAPRDPIAVFTHIRSAKRKCDALLREARVLEPLEAIAGRLLQQETISGDELYGSFFHKRCSAFHPTDPQVRCEKSPHPASSHVRYRRSARSGDGEDAPGIVWDGLPVPDHRLRVGQLTPNLKAMRALNFGGRPRALTQRWLEVLDAFDAPM
jgi:hypothetical protein